MKPATTGRIRAPPKTPIGICILAGGLSQRMGRDKARLPLGGSTLLALVRQTARQSGLPVRTIRRDRVPRSGPLGGIYTGLVTSRAEAELFLACDMPFIRPSVLRKLITIFRHTRRSVFVRNNDRACLPLLLPRNTLPTVKQQIDRKQLSIQALAAVLDVEFLELGPRSANQLLNINTPADWAKARNLWNKRYQS